jgi:phosphoadenosine phosphosulfate reductase
MSPQPFSSIDLAREHARLETAEAGDVLAWVERRFGPEAALASSFGVEDVALIDLAFRFAPSLRIFTLDTGRLHPETYEVMEAIRQRYGVRIETYFPAAEEVEALESREGFFSFRQSLEQRKACCALRKVAPLRRGLAGRLAWVTGLRREQSQSRAEVAVLELDSAHGGIAKVNPLAGWSEAQVWDYVRERGVPYNALHDRGFRSIGCAPCTRPMGPGDDPRSGRWWWESADHKECGLHRQP